MNHALRVRHQVLTVTMLLLSGGGLAAGVTARRPIPTMPALPAALLPASAPEAAATAATTPLRLDWSGAGEPQVSRDAAGRLSLVWGSPLRHPDPLLYGVPAAGEGLPGEGLPTGAVFLGAVSGSPAQRFPLPTETARLILFSLGHAQIVAAADLEGVP